MEFGDRQLPVQDGVNESSVGEDSSQDEAIHKAPDSTEGQSMVVMKDYSGPWLAVLNPCEKVLSDAFIGMFCIDKKQIDRGACPPFSRLHRRGFDRGNYRTEPRFLHVLLEIG